MPNKPPQHHLGQLIAEHDQKILTKLGKAEDRNGRLIHIVSAGRCLPRGTGSIAERSTTLVADRSAGRSLGCRSIDS